MIRHFFRELADSSAALAVESSSFATLTSAVCSSICAAFWLTSSWNGVGSIL